MKRNLKQYCNPKNRKRQLEMIEMAKCINPLETEGNACLSTYVDLVQRGKRATPVSNRIGYACW